MTTVTRLKKSTILAPLPLTYRRERRYYPMVGMPDSEDLEPSSGVIPVENIIGSGKGPKHPLNYSICKSETLMQEGMVNDFLLASWAPHSA